MTSTPEGGPPAEIKPKSYRMPGYPPQEDAEYLGQLCMPSEPDDRSEPESEEWLNPDKKWFDSHEEEDLNCYTGYD